MADETQGNPNIHADNDSIAFGSITVGGNVGDIHIGHGYTPEQVSTLIAQISTTFQPKHFEGRPPYKGLDFFGEEDSDLFFGREKLVEDLVSRLKERGKEEQPRTLFITGPSGSGKSSLVRAGLIPALRQGAIRDLCSERWLYATMRPGRDPFEAMAGAFSRLKKSPELGDYFLQHASEPEVLHKCTESILGDRQDQRLVVFIDQFEEVFTQLGKGGTEKFIELLDHAANVRDGRLLMLFALRSDFISSCALYPKLNALFNRQSFQIGGMQPEELVSAIAQPALRVGLRIDPDLIAQIINDMQGEPGALPLMQFALKDLFDAEKEKGGVIALTLEDYFQRGGIRKALERHADKAFNKLEDHEKELARSIFMRLIGVGDDTQKTRRTAFLDELVSENLKPEEARSVLQKLTDARLITTDEKGSQYTITHEKLIEAWQWLKRLVDENQEAIALQNEIDKDAKEWKDSNREASYLYSGTKLAHVNEKLKSNKLVLRGTAFEYIQASLRRQRRNRIILIGSVSAIITFLALAVIVFSRQANDNAKLARENANNARIAQSASTQAVAQKATAQSIAITAQANEKEAQRQAKISRVGELAAQSVSLREKNFLVSLLLGVEAFEETIGLVNSDQVQSALLDDTQANPKLEQFLSGHTKPVISVAFSPDGKTIASGGMDNTIILWDANTRQPIGRPLNGHKDILRSVVFSPDGKMLASASEDKTLILWDLKTHKPIGQPLSGHTDLVAAVAFSPDGKTLASGSKDKTIILWDVETRQPIGQPLTGHLRPVSAVAFSPDGKRLASASEDNTIILWDVETREPVGPPLSGHLAPVLSVAFSPDGKTLASGSYDKTIILWDVETQQYVGQPLKGHSNVIRSVAFSPDGKTLASGSYDRTVILWDVESGQPIAHLSGHSDLVTGVAFSPDGKTLVSSSGDKTMILWDVESAQSIGRPLVANSPPIYGMAFSPDGRTLASGGDDSTIILWDVESHKPIGQPLIKHSAPISSVAFSPDGKTLASGSKDNTIILWDVKTGKPIGQLSKHKAPISSVAFSPDGKTLASGSEDNTIILWDVKNRKPIGQPLSGQESLVHSVAFSPDGKTLASGSEDTTVILWDVESRQPIGQPLGGHTDAVRTVAFSPDGKTLVSGSEDRTIILWDVESHQPIGQPLSGHKGVVSSVIFSPDGKTLVSSSYDQTIILWDMESRQPIGQPLNGHAAPVLSAAFSPDGRTLASSSHNIILWDLDRQSWIDRSCQRAGRNFTREEWENFFPNEEYRPTCPQFPLEPAVTPTATP